METLQQLTPWRQEVEAKFLTQVGTTRVFLDGERSSCTRSECNMGNLVADSFVNYVRSSQIIIRAMITVWFYLTVQFVQFADEDEWSKVSIAFINAGSLRGGIDERNNNGMKRTFNLILQFNLVSWEWSTFIYLFFLIFARFDNVWRCANHFSFQQSHRCDPNYWSDFERGFRILRFQRSSQHSAIRQWIFTSFW